MLDIKFIQENLREVKEGCRKKGVDVDIDRLLELDKERRELIRKVEALKAERNKVSGGRGDEIAAPALPASKRGRSRTPRNDEGEREKAKEIKKEIKEMEPKLKEVKIEFEGLMFKVPNIISEDTPEGPDESGNKVLRKFKEPTEFDFKPKDHMELGLLHNLIDTEKSAKISGARFNYLFNEAVLMQFAIVQFVFAVLTDKKIIKELAEKVGNPYNKPFTPVIPPVIAKAEIMKKMGRFDPIEDRYYLEQDNSLLIGSAEHTLGPLHMNETIDEKDLPIRYIGYSTSFRREAGTYGKDTAGILRRHQFDKAEMETFIQSEHGLVEQDLIIAIQEYLLQQLEIPYQVVILCTGDMGGPDYRQVDMESWMPGQNKYRETHTSDYMTDYQARRLNIKVKRKNGETEFVHMNDATAFAMGRIIITIIENYQQKDGSIIIPKALRKYMGGIKKISGKR